MIDTHTHIYLEEFDSDRKEIVKRAQNAGVVKAVLPAVDSFSYGKLLDCTDEFPQFCFAAAGLHPTSVKSDYKTQLKFVEQQLGIRNDIVAIGETGMDLYWDKTFGNEQRTALQTQIEWALELNLPVIIHSRDAFDDIMDVLQKFKRTALRGVFHSFGGTPAQAKQILDFGNFFLGINGIVTFKNSKLAETLASVPVERIVTETDAPYLTPAPFRGSRNEPAYLNYVVKKLSEIYQLSENEINLITEKNAKQIFGI